jgi:dGTPase
MDWADDTAYAVNDLVDSISGGFINIAKLQKWRKINLNSLNELKIDALDQIEKWIKEDTYKSKFGSEIGKFILACKIEERDSFMNDLTNRYKYLLSVDNNSFELIEMYKKIAVDLVFRSPQLHQMEFKGNNMITKMFNVFAENYITEITGIELLPSFTNNLIKQEETINGRARLVCDYLAGMTDAFALTNYKRLFDPDYSSITDIF